MSAAYTSGRPLVGARPFAVKAHRGPSVAEQAVLTAKLHDFDVPPSVPIALRDARRASQRGLGLPKKASPFPLKRVNEDFGQNAEHQYGQSR